ncbi:hypothetical protein ACFLS5_04870 [Candidatus Bipolaricaulota bacterium]
MGDVLIVIGAVLAILLGAFHFLSTKKALGGFPDLAIAPRRMLLGMWNGVGFMVIYLGAIPLALVLLGAYAGTCKTAVGISAVALAGVLAIADVVTYWPAKSAIPKAVSPVFAVIAALIAVGTFVL